MKACRYCQAPITLKQHPSGKNWIPFNEDHSIHRCKGRRKAERERQPDFHMGKTITGAGYVELGCPVPPWKECNNYEPTTRTCRVCGEPVLIRNVGGKITSTDPGDGRKHYLTCLFARRNKAI
jgi:hypothetical protein